MCSTFSVNKPCIHACMMLHEQAMSHQHVFIMPCKESPSDLSDLHCLPTRKRFDSTLTLKKHLIWEQYLFKSTGILIYRKE